ncbi:hypothetical protein [Tunturiibacter gelidoferens]|uniref:TonB-dependent transporter Oar-like beta-barrel domain-containing protein n=1 Tax=Tunturiibacter gelidiferens TaxID=3069689 RepID=A0A9X0Q9Z4_9BACT|nr:hypothetical protein [Edaphobacter lichenicola]MBB5326756.1 hypothetical protein [Edaphobacter lichenicola]
MDTFTAGATILLTPAMLNDFRANWSQSTAGVTTSLTDFQGAVVPPLSNLFPSSSPYTPGTGQALVFFPDGEDMEVRQGRLSSNSEQQLNFVDTLSWAFGTHLFKFGVDYRRLTPTAGPDRGYAFFPSSFALLRAGTVDTALLSNFATNFSDSLDLSRLFIPFRATSNHIDSWKHCSMPASRKTQIVECSSR